MLSVQLPLVTSRGVQLATLFMAGVETALLANDACGAPIPWLMCCPWLYFDGKLFHHTLARATISKNLLELCSGHIDRVVKVERMRKAILEGITVMFARPPLPVTPGILHFFQLHINVFSFIYPPLISTIFRNFDSLISLISISHNYYYSAIYLQFLSFCLLN